MSRQRSSKKQVFSSADIEKQLAAARSELNEKKSNVETLESQLRHIKDAEKAVFFDVLLDAAQKDIDFAQTIVDIAEKDASNRKPQLKNWLETIRGYHTPKNAQADSAPQAQEKSDDEILAEMEAEEQKKNEQQSSHAPA